MRSLCRLVFARFAEGAEPRVRRLSSFETIERLMTDRRWLELPEFHGQAPQAVKFTK